MPKRETIDVKTYEEWEAEHRETQRRVHSQRRRERAREKRFFLKQKLYGLTVCAFAFVVAVIGENMQWANLNFFADIVLLFGLYTAVTQKKIIIDDVD